MAAEMAPGDKFLQKALHSPRERLSIILWLAAAHSFFVGLGLMLFPDSWLSFFGFAEGGERFFRVQAGIFHIVMVVAYTMGAKRCSEASDAVLIAMGAKLVATVFLLLYFVFISRIWMVLLSAVLDGVLGLMIFGAFISCRRCAKRRAEDRRNLALADQPEEGALASHS